MKIIAIGDIHGREIWKKILEAEQGYDKVIFIGDYFDSKERITAQKQIDNFKEISALKETEKDKVILLFGNHDFHYLNGINDRYSGYQTIDRKEISKCINKAYKDHLFQICTIEPPYLFSHAGLTKTWCANNLTLKDYNNYKAIEEEVNDLFTCFPEQFGFTIGANNDSSGDDVTQSPIWVRPDSLKKDKLDHYIQLVGHTVQEKLLIENDFAFIDTLGTTREYLVIDNKEMKVKKAR